ncbi:MAG: carbon-nitrogen hydrolase family protein, partial [Chloroflexi bacterium]|nr:carbon-nitrogen hydrolase family protein [Chloroflexota bacterium]
MAATNYEKIVTLAVVNYQSTWGNKRAGLDKIKKLAKRAADQDNNIIVFPEMALTGYESGGSKDMYRESAELVPGPATDELAELARKLDVYLVLGMPERDRANPDIIYNSSAVLGPEGFIGRYRKIGLSPPPFYDESLYFTPGRELPVFETRYGIIGVQICRDFWLYPEQTRILVLKGARLIVNPTASPKGADGGIFLTQQTRARATENMVYA